MWTEAITYMVIEGIQLERGDMFNWIDLAENVDLDESDKLKRQAMNKPVVESDLPF